jgi:L-asparaginase II
VSNANPILIEVTRGSGVESRHRGAFAIVDADGGIFQEIGDVRTPVFPRSAVKAFQALPFVECGAAETLGPDAIALASGSHSGEEEHVQRVSAMLATVGRDESALVCAAHWPLSDQAARALASAKSSPSRLHNNCSGKHAAFICTACALGVAPQGYERREHTIQRLAEAAIEDVTQYRLNDATAGIDGCGIPAHVIPLYALAHGFARFVTGSGLSPSRAAAAARIAEAVGEHPHLIGGSGRYDSAVARLSKGRVFIKAGAEGVYCAGIRSLGLGIAVKIDDGAQRAAEALIGALLIRLMSDEAITGPIQELAPRIRTWAGHEAGVVRPVEQALE